MPLSEQQRRKMKLMAEPSDDDLAQAIEHLAGRLEPILGKIDTVVEGMTALKDEQDKVVLTLRGTNGGEINPGLLREFASLRERFNVLEAASKDAAARRIPWTAVIALISALGAIAVAWLNN